MKLFNGSQGFCTLRLPQSLVYILLIRVYPKLWVKFHPFSDPIFVRGELLGWLRFPPVISSANLIALVTVGA